MKSMILGYPPYGKLSNAFGSLFLFLKSHFRLSTHRFLTMIIRTPFYFYRSACYNFVDQNACILRVGDTMELCKFRTRVNIYMIPLFLVQDINKKETRWNNISFFIYVRDLNQFCMYNIIHTCISINVAQRDVKSSYRQNRSLGI